MNDLLRRLLFLPPQASTYAWQVDLLHFCVIGTTMLGATVVFALALYYVARYGRSAPGQLTAHKETSTTVEAVFIGGLLALFVGFWVVGTRQYDAIMTPPPGAMPVYVTAKQWMWKFAYADGRQAIDELTVPAHRPIELVMTSRDVIHSFYVPAFRVKHDVVPGRYYTVWFEAASTGVFPIECAEFCGTSHSAMTGRVRVLSERDYAAWLEATPKVPPYGEDVADGDRAAGQPQIFGAGPSAVTPSDRANGDLAVLGRDVAVKRGCFNCHTLDGQPHIGPTWAGLYRSSVRLADGSVVTADEAYLTRSMMDPLADVVSGYAPVMPTYRGVLAQPEVAALLELMKSAQHAPYAPSVLLPPVTAAAVPPEPLRSPGP